MKKKLTSIFLVFALILTFAQIIQADSPDYGGTFVDTVQTDFEELFNPILFTSSYDQQVIDLMFDGLVSRNSNGEMVPNIAESWDISEDGLEITFYLNDDVKFHDGEKLTAEDVAFTFKTIFHPDYTGTRFGTYNVIEGAKEYNNGEADDVSGIEILDDYTIRFTLEEEDVTLLGDMSRGIIPKHLLEDIPVAELEDHDFNREPVGSGPFKFSEYSSQQYIVLESFDDYFKGRPYLDEYVVRVVSTDSVPAYLRREEVDLAEVENKEQFEELANLDELKGFTRTSEAFRYFGMNQAHPLIGNKNIRQALAYGFDQEVIIDLLDGHGTLANGAIPPVSWAYTSDVNQYNYNPDLAVEMLEEEGYDEIDDEGYRINEDGERLSFDLSTTSQDIRVEISEIFQEFMKQIGVEVSVDLMEFNSLIDKVVETEDWGMYILGWATGPEPDMSWILASDAANNDVRFFDDYNDELLAEGKRTVDQEERKEIYHEWQQYVSEELPYMFLYYPELTTIMNERVRGYNEENQRGLFIDEDGGMVHKIWIPEEKQN
ncbi:MAG: ABC transporter substrate-binding protein [Halanaerobiales bacterium]